MRKYFAFLAVIVFSFVCISVTADELTFGAYDLDDTTVSAQELSVLHDTLGFNYFIVDDCADCDEIDYYWVPSGITLINQCGDTIKACTNYHYGMFDAEERGTQIDFFSTGGTDGDTTWISDYAADTLFGPNYCIMGHTEDRDQYVKMERNYIAEAQMPPGDSIIVYYARVRLMIDNANGSDSAVAILENHYMPWGCVPDEVFHLDTIRVSDFDGVGSNNFLEIYRTFNIPDSIDVDCGSGTVTKVGNNWGAAVVLAATGIRQVSVDWIKIYDLPGIDLVENNLYDGRIGANANNYFDCATDFWGWYIRDEPFPLQLHPAGYTLEIARDSVDADWNFIAPHNAIHATDYWFEVVNTPIISHHFYPFKYVETDSTSYTDYNSDPNSSYDPLTIQNSLNNCTLNWYNAYHTSACSANAEFWAMPQSFGGCDPYNCWRRPTPSEFSCQTWLALASGAKAINYWKYDRSWSPANGYTIEGLRLWTGERSELWYKVRDDINPYIKAIDSTYLSLTWETAYAVNPEQAFPSGSSGFIDDITACTNPDSSGSDNPDLGWLHVGEYHDDSNDKYFMLVNRACSKDEYGNEAPSVTAVVELNSTAIGSDFVFVIDIAKGTNANNWVGYPDTTYVAVTHGFLSYSTILRAGEGRLYKVVPTNERW